MSETPRPHLRWPPPGLERIQGDLWRVATIGALAGGLMVLPLLFVLTRDQEFASLGPFADAWWLTLLFGVTGLGAAMDALGTTKRILTRTASALEEGYDLRTVLFVLADRRRDSGFLLQGGRHFSEMDTGDRATVAYLRVMGVVSLACAGLWMSVALGIMLILIPRTGLGTTTLWVTTLFPAGIMYAVAAVALTLEDGRVRKARRAWFTQPWSADFVAEDVKNWREEIASHGDSGLQGRADPSTAPLFRRLGVVAVVLAIIIAVPVFTLLPTSAVGPILASVAVPNLDRVQERAAEVEAYRPYRVEADPSLSPQEAGVVLHSLAYTGSEYRGVDGEREPEAPVAQPWIPQMEGENPVGAEPHRWEETIFQAVAAGPSPELRAFLAEIASHPSHAQFAWLARAERVDAAAGRWTESFPPTLDLASLPLPQLSGLREAAWAHIALAGHELANGRAGAAEEALQEVISVGFVLGDHGPTLIDNLVGYSLVQSGGRALEHFYRVTDRDADLERLVAVRGTAERAVRLTHHRAPVGVESIVRTLPPLVMDTTAIRGLRWEAFILTATLTPCLNLQRMVFGPDEDYEAFVRRARAELVEFPSEEKLFDLAQSGYFLVSAEGDRSILGTVLGVAMTTGPGTCGTILSQAQNLMSGI